MSPNSASGSRRSQLTSVLAIVAASLLAGGCYVWLPVADHAFISALLLVAGTARPMRSHPAPLSSRRRRGKLRRTDLRSG